MRLHGTKWARRQVAEGEVAPRGCAAARGLAERAVHMTGRLPPATSVRARRVHVQGHAPTHTRPVGPQVRRACRMWQTGHPHTDHRHGASPPESTGAPQDPPAHTGAAARAQGGETWSEALQLGQVPVQIQGLRVREGPTVIHSLPGDDLLHSHLHLLAVERVLPGGESRHGMCEPEGKPPSLRAQVRVGRADRPWLPAPSSQPSQPAASRARRARPQGEQGRFHHRWGRGASSYPHSPLKCKTAPPPGLAGRGHSPQACLTVCCVLISLFTFTELHFHGMTTSRDFVTDRQPETWLPPRPPPNPHGTFSEAFV